jgi:hypothetical protein
LYTAHEEQEEETLQLLMNICDYPFGIQQIVKNQSFPDYLALNYARTKEIYDLKQDLKNKVVENLHVFEKKDSVVNQFLMNLKEAFESKKA